MHQMSSVKWSLHLYRSWYITIYGSLSTPLCSGDFINPLLVNRFLSLVAVKPRLFLPLKPTQNASKAVTFTALRRMHECMSDVVVENVCNGSVAVVNDNSNNIHRCIQACTLVAPVTTASRMNKANSVSTGPDWCVLGAVNYIRYIYFLNTMVQNNLDNNKYNTQDW